MNLNTNAWNRLRYDLYAPLYDAFVEAPFKGARARSIDALRLQRGERVLITGCGTGLDFEHLPAEMRVTAGDIAPAMVRRAQREADRLGFAGADVRVMDAHRLDLPPGTFDAAVLHLVLAVVPDPQATIREVARVLKPGGRAVILDKFLPDGASPSPLRRAANAVTSVLATGLNRQLGPLLAEARLVLEHRGPALLGGLFEIALVRKPASTDA